MPDPDDSPADALAAVTHRDPYPYYAALAERPLAFDPSLGLWLAARPADVAAVLASPRCRVRPPAEPVPRALASPAADVFARLVRFDDGPAQAPRKRALAAVLDERAVAEVGAAAVGWAVRLWPTLTPQPERLVDFALALPAYAMAAALGFTAARVPEVAGDVPAFVRSIGPSASADERDAGQRAASRLVRACERLGADAAPGLFTRLRGALGDDDAAVANAIGLLVQSYEASAGLLGNTLVALGQDAAAGEAVADGAALEAVVAEAARRDPAAQNTRRFVAEGGDVAGQRLAAGDAILVVLAAAARAPAAASFAFGAGAHACPGARLAVAIAAAGVRTVLATGLDPRRLAATRRYRPSPNLRVPCWPAGA